jgi:hypothetical protein
MHTVLMSHADLQLADTGLREHCINFRQAVGKRLFEEYVDAGLETRQSDFRMQVMRRSNRHRINNISIEHRAVVRKAAHLQRRCSSAQGLLVYVCKRSEFDPFVLQYPLDMVFTNPGDANDSIAQPAHCGHRLCRTNIRVPASPRVP